MSKKKDLNVIDAINTNMVHITQVFHQITIPETPTGLIGEKVVYNKKYLKMCKENPPSPLPECGYFTITKAILDENSNVMVALYPYNGQVYRKGVNISLSNMEKL